MLKYETVWISDLLIGTQKKIASHSVGTWRQKWSMTADAGKKSIFISIRNDDKNVWFFSAIIV